MDEPQAKILVVDDEVKNVKLLEALLLLRRYTIVRACHGEEALQQVQQKQPPEDYRQGHRLALPQ